MTYTEATEFLFSLRRFGWRLGLETIQRLLDLLGNPQQGLPSVHIGGTNGKGSTAAMLAAILQAGGRRTGLYTSPHLLDFTERIRVNGRPIGEVEVTRLTAQLIGLCAAHFAPFPAPKAPPERPLSPPDFLPISALAFLPYRNQATGPPIIEVGLGGRFD